MSNRFDYGCGIYDDYRRRDADDDDWKTLPNGVHIQVGENGEVKKGPKVPEKGEVNTHNPNRNYGSYKVGTVRKGSTLEKYTKNGELTPERQKLHQQIIDSILDKIPKPDGQPTATFLGGGPAGGKGTIRKSDDVETPDDKKTACIDPDAIKKMIPEYRDAVSRGDHDAAEMAHDESSMIAWNAFAIAQDEGYDCMMDGTGDGTVEDMLQSIREAKDKGMKVVGKYVTCDTDVAVQRARDRAEKDGPDKGRKVPEDYIRRTHRNVSKILPEIAKEFDSVELYCTDAGDKPILIGKGGGGKGMTVTNQALYDMFLEKANEEIDDGD